MGYNSSVNNITPDNISGQEAVKEAIASTQAGEIPKAIRIFEERLAALSQGTISDRRVAASAFSFYGLCVATQRRKYGEGVKYCKISLRSNPMDPEHRINLAMVYLERDDRAKAVESLNAGLRLDRRNRRLNYVLDSVGRRRPPVLTFLSRGNPLNVWLGKKRSDHEQRFARG